MSNQPSKAELKRRRAQSHRDKERHRREQEEADRRYWQSERDRARNRYRAPMSWRFAEIAPVTVQPSWMESEEPEPKPGDSGPAKALAEGVSALFNSKKHADVTIYLGNYELPAHALILSIGSGYFNRAFESGFQEQDTKTFRFDQGYEHAHWRVFSYIYKGSYSDRSIERLEVEDDNELLRHAHVYRLADYFQMDGLKSLARTNFRMKLLKSWDTDDFARCISEVYGEVLGDFAELKRAAVYVVAQRIKECLRNTDLQNYMRRNGNFAMDVLEEYSSAQEIGDDIASSEITEHST